jgi:hypothetical protein
MQIHGLKTKWGGAQAITMHPRELALILACLVAVFWIRYVMAPSAGAAVDHGHATTAAVDYRHGAPPLAP